MLKDNYPSTLKIPYFIIDYANYGLQIYYVVKPIKHECGYEYFIFPWEKELHYLYRTWYKNDLKELMSSKLEYRCGQCNEIILTEKSFRVNFIDLDYKVLYLYDFNSVTFWLKNYNWLKYFGIDVKEHTSLYYLYGFFENGYRIEYFNSFKEFKHTLTKKYNPI